MTFENHNISLIEMEKVVTLRGLLKEEFQIENLNGKTCFMVPTDHFIKFFRQLNEDLKRFCTGNKVCQHDRPCFGHQCFKYLQNLKDYLEFYVEDEKTYYNYLFFKKTDFKAIAFGGWTGEWIRPKCLKYLSYSSHLVYLN